MHSSNRQAFTLLEMLITTGIFLFGFMAVYALFLIGVESRQKAEQITRTSLAADAMLEDWRIRFSVAEFRQAAPAAFIGDGNPLTPTALGNGAGMNERAFATSPDHPGVLFRVIDCTDLSGGNNDNSSAVYLELLVLYQPGTVQSMRAQGERVISYSDLIRRLPKLYGEFRNLNDGERDPATWSNTSAEDFERRLIDTNVAQRYQTVINRTRLAGT